MNSAEWDRRYSGRDLVWSAGPNRWVEEVAGGLPPGRALDLAAGEGRNALWLAERGWTVTAVDFSAVALRRARSLAERRLGAAADRIALVEADLADYEPDGPYDLVISAYLQVPAALRRRVLRAAAGVVADGGLLLVVAHDSDNLAHGTGGPQDPAVLYTAADAASDIAGGGLRVVTAEARHREVPGDDGVQVAVDSFLLARREPSPAR